MWDVPTNVYSYMIVTGHQKMVTKSIFIYISQLDLKVYNYSGLPSKSSCPNFISYLIASGTCSEVGVLFVLFSALIFVSSDLQIYYC